MNKSNTNQNSPTKFNLTEKNSKRIINENSKLYNTINNESNINSTLEDIKKTTIENIETEDKEEQYSDFKQRSKTVRFKQEDISEKDQKFQFTTSESENYDISSKELPDFTKKKECKTTNNSGNVSDSISKSGVNNDNLSIENNTNLNMKKNKKIGSKKKKTLMSIKNKKNVINKSINSTKDIRAQQTNKQKEKEIGKLFKEMNEDYNNDIEMLKRQEEQIKLMLSLIDLNDNDN